MRCTAQCHMLARCERRCCCGEGEGPAPPPRGPLRRVNVWQLELKAHDVRCPADQRSEQAASARAAAPSPACSLVARGASPVLRLVRRLDPPRRGSVKASICKYVLYRQRKARKASQGEALRHNGEGGLVLASGLAIAASGSGRAKAACFTWVDQIPKHRRTPKRTVVVDIEVAPSRDFSWVLWRAYGGACVGRPRSPLGASPGNRRFPRRPPVNKISEKLTEEHRFSCRAQ